MDLRPLVCDPAIDTPTGQRQALTVRPEAPGDRGHLERLVLACALTSEVFPAKHYERTPAGIARWFDANDHYLVQRLVVDSGDVACAATGALLRVRPYLVRYLSGRGIGCSNLYEIAGVATHPDHRNSGLAGATLDALESQADAGGMSTVMCVLGGNERALGFYEARGFRRHGKFNGKDGLNHVLMRLTY